MVRALSYTSLVIIVIQRHWVKKKVIPQCESILCFSGDRLLLDPVMN